jgi:hypothetical protein
VEEVDPRCAFRAVDEVDVDEIVVGRLPALAAQRDASRRREQGGVDRLQVRVGEPARRPDSLEGQ